MIGYWPNGCRLWNHYNKGVTIARTTKFYEYFIFGNDNKANHENNERRKTGKNGKPSRNQSGK